MNKRKNDLLLISNTTLTEKMITKINDFVRKSKTAEIDIILNTFGGEVFSTLAMIDILKSTNKIKNIFIPYYAMSGGTLMALACDKIYMTPISSLGCVDPQIGIWYKGSFSKASLDYVVKKKERLASDDTFAMLHEVTQYEKSINATVKSLQPKLSDKTINLLTKGQLEHAYRFTPQKAQNLGLKVNIMDNDIAEMMYNFGRVKKVKGFFYKKGFLR
jgi:ClpP class serine protease